MTSNQNKEPFRHKNLAVYVHYDKHGDVSDYVIYCLKGLQDVAERIMVVINGELSDIGRTVLKELGVDVLVRKNAGYDWWGWKAGIEHFGYDTIAQYDSLILTNNTYYGPIFPFSEMFNIMESKECDFWGINRSPAITLKRTSLPEHLQSYFLVFNKSILNSPDFCDYWKNIQPYNSWHDAVILGEAKLTKYFESRGFKSESYMSYKKYSKLIQANPTILTDMQIMEDRCPVAKRKYFFEQKFHSIQFARDYSTRKLLSFLEADTNYDVNLIWDDLLKTQHSSVIKDNLHTNFILPADCCQQNEHTDNEKIAVILYIYYEDLVPYIFRYAQSIPEHIDIYVVSASDEITNTSKKLFSHALSNKLYFRTQINHGKDITALPTTCSDVVSNYEYVCFMHSKSNTHASENIFEESFRDHCFMSLLYSKEYICNIINLFKKNAKLGLLIPPTMNQGDFVIIGNEWDMDKEKANTSMRDLFGLDIELDPHPLGAFGGMFWARTAALRTFMSRKWNFSSFPEKSLPDDEELLAHNIERFMPDLVRHDNYYTAFVSPTDYAETYYNSLYYTMREFKKSLFTICGTENDAQLLRLLPKPKDKINIHWRIAFGLQRIKHFIAVYSKPFRISG